MVESMPVKATSAEDSLRKKLMCQPILQAPWILNVFFLLLSWFLQSLVVLRSSITSSQLTLQSSFKPLSSLVSLFFLLPVWLTAPARVTDCKSLAGDFLEISRRRFWSQPLLWTSCACVRAFLPTSANLHHECGLWWIVDSPSYASLAWSVGEKGTKVGFTRCQHFKQTWRKNVLARCCWYSFNIYSLCKLGKWMYSCSTRQR